MSDSDAGDDGTAGDSDDDSFDKEALREELREKYEADEREREATQRMSDLLLKGATMTNAHCGTCGSPLFQHDGTTFCPSCHGGPEGVEASLGDDGGAGQQGEIGQQSGTGQQGGAGRRGVDPVSAADDVGPDADFDEGTASSTDIPVTDAANGTHGTDGIEETGDTEPSPGSSGRPADRQSADAPHRPHPTDRSDSELGSGDSPSVQPSAPGGSISHEGGDVAAGRDWLVAALERFARRAAETDDPRYARECLEAAREAAEALAALR